MKSMRRTSLQPAAGATIWRKSDPISKQSPEIDSEALADRHRIEISAAGDWSDNVYRPKTSASFMDWVVGRRGAKDTNEINSTLSRTGGNERMVYEGYLEKLGSWRKNWKRRWFILRRDSLYYYEQFSHNIEDDSMVRDGSIGLDSSLSSPSFSSSIEPIDLALSSKQRQATSTYANTTETTKPLGEIQLCARGADGQINIALVWDYSEAIADGYIEVTSTVLKKYAPPKKGHGGGGGSSFKTQTSSSLKTEKKATSKSSSSHTPSSLARVPPAMELARCFGIRCAATQRDLFVRADSLSSLEGWMSTITRQAQRAQIFEVATSGAIDHLADLDASDELKALSHRHHKPPSSSSSSSSSSSTKSSKVDGSPKTLHHKNSSQNVISSEISDFSSVDESSQFNHSVKAAFGDGLYTELNGTGQDILGIGVSVSIPAFTGHLNTAVIGPEDHVFIGVFVGDLPDFLPHHKASTMLAVERAKQACLEEDRRDPKNHVYHGSKAPGLETMKSFSNEGDGGLREGDDDEYRNVTINALSPTSDDHNDFSSSQKSPMFSQQTSNKQTSSSSSSTPSSQIKLWENADHIQITQLITQSHQFTNVCITEGLKAGDVGSFEIGNNETIKQFNNTDQDFNPRKFGTGTSMNSGGTSGVNIKEEEADEDEDDDSVRYLRQFSVLLPTSKVAWVTKDHLLFVLYRATSRAEEVSQHEILGFSLLDATQLRRFVHAGNNTSTTCEEFDASKHVKTLSMKLVGRQSVAEQHQSSASMYQHPNVQQQHPTTSASSSVGVVSDVNSIRAVNGAALPVSGKGRRKTVNTGKSSRSFAGPSNRGVPTSYSMFNFNSPSKTPNMDHRHPPPSTNSFSSSTSSLSFSSVQQQQHRQKKAFLSLSVVRKDPVQAVRAFQLRQQSGFGLEPYAEAGFRFSALNGHKVLAQSECHISPFGVAVPKAFVSMLCLERFRPLALDKQRVESKKRRIEKLIVQSEKSAIAEIPVIEWQTQALPPSDRLLLMAEKARLMADSKSLDQLTDMLGEYLKCKELYGQMLRMGGCYSANTGQSLGDGDQFEELKAVLSPVETFRTRTRYLLKRSTKKKDFSLRFIPTNLNVQVMHAREKSCNNHYHRHSNRGSHTQLTRNIEATTFGVKHDDVSTFPSLTLGCPAAHSFGYKQGGLRRMLGVKESTVDTHEPIVNTPVPSAIVDNHFGTHKAPPPPQKEVVSGADHGPSGPDFALSFGEVSSRLAHCRKLSDWSIPDGQLKMLAKNKAKWHKERKLKKEREKTFEALAKIKLKEFHEYDQDSILKMNFHSLPSRTLSYIEESEIDLSFVGSVLLSYFNSDLSESKTPNTSTNKKKFQRNPSIANTNEKPVSAEDRQNKFSDVLALIQRLDAVNSQILAAVVTQISSLLSFAESGSTVHLHILPRVLKAGFLFSIQSLLSTRGDELGMLEDMVAASEWLNTVSVRLIVKTISKDSDREDEFGSSENGGVQENKTVRHIEKASIEPLGSDDKAEQVSQTEDDDEEDDDVFGDDVGCSDSSPCIFTRRNRKTGGIVVDLETDEDTAKIVFDALNFSSLNRSFHSMSSSTFRSDKNQESKNNNDDDDDMNKTGNDQSRRRFADRVGSGDGSWNVVAEIPIVSVLFQQGINEQQAVCNAISAKALLFQSSVNKESLDRLEKFLILYKDISIDQATGGKSDIVCELKNWDDALDSLRRSVYSQLKINVHIILHASNLCRQLSGTHAICCKSGKDRTSMLVSLEEARLLCDHLRVIGGRKACTVSESMPSTMFNGSSYPSASSHHRALTLEMLSPSSQSCQL